MTDSYRLRRALVVAADQAAVILALVLAFLLRFDFRIEAHYFSLMLGAVPLVMGSFFVSAYVFGIYRGIYHFSSIDDLLNIMKSVAAAAVLSATTVLFFLHGSEFPRSVLLLQPILAFLGKCGVRLAVRVGKNYLKARRFSVGEWREVLLVGAGELGESVLRSIESTPEARYRVVGFLDDDPAKWGMSLRGFPILGGLGLLAKVLEKRRVDEVIITLTARRGEVVRSVMDAVRPLEDRPELKIAPGLEEMFRSPRPGGVAVRRVRPADLLNREVVRLDEKRIARCLDGKTVLVTGGGGTIGSELCRQALRYGPRRLVLMDNHATSLFQVERELLGKARGAGVAAVLGDVRDQALLERVFKEHRPELVLHAAAHKHVGQLESNAAEGISNNLVGTWRTAAAAHGFGAEAFLLVSTDKAVNPASVMGATKRAAELVVQWHSHSSKTRFSAVRFGNVLGSSGSVLRIFEEQIARGGPITVTDPRMTRYFMTEGEAVSLILQAASLARGGEIFVLKMGTPVRIMDMARNLLMLSGLEPGKDIEIRVTGPRPGEKLDEELVEAETEAAASEHPDITIVRKSDGAPADLEKRVLDLEILARGSDERALVRKLRELVPTYRPAPRRKDLPAGT